MKSITEFISVGFFETGEFAVIDTGQRETILKELDFSNSGCSDEECQLEIGQLLSAEYIVVGNISLIGDRYLVTAKMLETESSLTIKTAKGMYDDINALLDGVEALVENLTSSESLASGPVTEELDTSVTSGAEEKPGEKTVKEEPAAPEKPKPERTPVKIETKYILPTTLAVAAAGGIGVGAYFFYDANAFYESTYLPALDAYNNAPAASSEADFDTLWAALDTASTTKNTKTIIGYSCAAAGITAGVFSTILFIRAAGNETDDNEVKVETLNFIPSPEGFTISGRLSVR